MTRHQELRHECLLQLYGGGSLAVSVAHIAKVTRREGFDYEPAEIREALFFLEGQGFCTHAQDPATGEQRFRITSAGMLHYEANE